MIQIGQLVMLVGCDDFMPPLGAIGEVVDFDGDDYLVLFPRHPCPVPPGITWYAAPSWLMPIDGGLADTEQNNSLTEHERCVK